VPEITDLFFRNAQPLVLEALADTRVVFVAGARQVGKSTLAREIARSGYPAEELSLDNQGTREAALADPEGFVAGLTGPAFIDEIQRAPDLLLAIKDVVDRDLAPGRFLLTGSANVLTARKVKDALTGRMETIPLWPLAQSEIHRTTANFVDALFASEPPRVVGATVGRAAFVAVVAAGGYPEARLRSGRRRTRWFASYLDTTLDRDLRDISDARKLDEVPRLLRLLASQAANVLSYRAIAAKLDLTHDTVREYIGLLQTVFLVRLLPAWRPGIGAREAHAPKAYLVDSGLLAHLLGADERRIAADDQVTGKVLENFAVTEVLKHADWAGIDTTAYHYRQREGEVDLVLESRAGEIVAIEVKAAASVSRRDVRAMEKLRDGSGERFRTGVVLCTCAQTIPLGERLWAVPVSGLWAAVAPARGATAADRRRDTQAGV
jgi:predicted AAA+ superfamily ATPase